MSSKLKRCKLPIILPPKNCDGCGACCMEQAALPASWYVPVGAEGGDSASGKPVPESLLQSLRDQVKHWLATTFPIGPCIWFDQETKRCRHYEYRPSLCRDGVLVGDAACMRWRKTFGVV